MLTSDLAKGVRQRLGVTFSCVVILMANVDAAAAQPTTRNIVGLGATACRQFNAEIAKNPESRRDYLSWAQGYMSGILLGRPPGIDDGLDLNPPTFGLASQLKFIEDYCAGNASMGFADAVEALYKRLRREGKT